MILLNVTTSFSSEEWVGEVLPLLSKINFIKSDGSKCTQLVTADEVIIGHTFWIPRNDQSVIRLESEEDVEESLLVLLTALQHLLPKKITVTISSTYTLDLTNVKKCAKELVEPNPEVIGAFAIIQPLNFSLLESSDEIIQILI